MYKNYFKSAMRSLLRNRIYSSINILGLALGLTCCLIIYLLVQFELSFDTFHEKGADTYRITGQFYRGDDISYQAHTPFPMAAALRTDFPDLVNVTQVYFNFNGYVRTNENEEFMVNDVLFADEEYLDVFDFELIEGNRMTALTDPNTVVLTQGVAERLFGNQSAVGKVIELNNALTLRVSGILGEIPENTHQPFGMLVSYKSFTQDYYELDVPLTEWDHTDLGSTYVVLPPGYSPAIFEQQLAQFAAKYVVENFDEYGKYVPQPLYDIHFDVRYAESNGGKTIEKSSIWTFAFIGLVLLVAACINFINLSTAQSIKRSKEVGIRKVLGAHRPQLIKQFLGETLILTTLAAILAIVLVEILLPVANGILEINLELDLIGDIRTLSFLILLMFIVTILGGFYPALLLSGFQPAKALRASKILPAKGGISLRKFLVIFQFAIAQILIIATLISYNQLEYFRNKPLGYEPEMVINFGTGILDSAEKQLFKARIMSNSAVSTVSWFSSSPTNNGHLYGPFRLLDQENPEPFRTTHRSIDKDYLETFGIELVAGKDIDDEIGKEVPGVLVNEKLLKVGGITDPEAAIGQRIKATWDIGTARIVGVVKDFHNQSLHREIIPTIFFYNPGYHWRAAIKLKSVDPHSTIQYLESAYNELFPSGIFIYQFEDQRMAEFYEQEEKTYEAFQLFAVIAVLICCLGLFGLISFVANQKIKEVGIRKVMGANLHHIMILFGQQYIGPLLMAFTIAVPIGYFIMDNWLAEFAYRQPVGLGVFIATLLVSGLIAVFTVSYHSLKSARMNPIESLRDE